MLRSTPRPRAVSQTRLLCATIFTAAFLIGLGVAFAAGLGSRGSESIAAASELGAVATQPDLALASLSDGAPPADASFQLASLESTAPALAATPIEQRDRIYTSGVIARGESLAYALGEHGISRLAVHQITSELAHQFDFRRSQPGHAYRVTQDADGRVVELRYSISTMDGFTVALEGDRYVARRDDLQLIPREVRIAGVISTTLHDAVKALGESPQLASDFADIFAWDIDFTRSVRPGDEFRVLYERLYFIDGNGRESYLRPGRILAAHYVGAAGALAAIYYENQPGQGSYYHTDGSSVQRQFLQAPLRFARISSRYSAARHHPILRITRPHEGIDYSAPAGTPIWAVADGRVIYRGNAGGFGNLVKIRHARGYVSYYGHLSRFGSGLKVGQHVRQKQVIGYVGSTGLSTGPHVCFRIAQGGRYFNPAKLHPPAGDGVSAQRLKDFLASRDSLLARLDAGSVAAANEAL